MTPTLTGEGREATCRDARQRQLMGELARQLGIERPMQTVRFIRRRPPNTPLDAVVA